jgi:hypothetical protein
MIIYAYLMHLGNSPFYDLFDLSNTIAASKYAYGNTGDNTFPGVQAQL